MKVVALPITTVLFEPGAPIDAVHFPISGVVSLVTAFEDGSIVEVATIGNEGIVGVPHMAGGSLAVRAISLVPGASLRLDSAAFVVACERPGPFRDLVHNYLQALFAQVSKATACNRLHSNRQRLSRWLLMCHDRVGLDQFQIAHELVGQMLGTRRATATPSARLLQAAGLIRYQRGQVTIVNREGLESVSCECYQVVKNALDRVVATVPPGPAPTAKPQGREVRRAEPRNRSAIPLVVPREAREAKSAIFLARARGEAGVPERLPGTRSDTALCNSKE